VFAVSLRTLYLWNANSVPMVQRDIDCSIHQERNRA